MWLKTENFSNACGTSTLKSLLPQAFAVSNVHPRPRKRLARCTLDCGFKTPESPALRGFVVGPHALATAALYLVLLSNGHRRPKIRLKKFSFSPKIVPADIVKKLPSQRCSQPFLIAFFNFSHKRPTFAFTSESVYTLGSRRKIAHNGSHGETRGVSDGTAITTLGAFRTFTNIPGPGVRTANFAALRSWPGCSRRTQKAFGTAMRLCASLFRRRRGPAGLRDLFRFCRNRDLYIRRSWFSACARHGWYHYPRCALCAVEIPGGRLSKRLICRFLRLGSLH